MGEKSPIYSDFLGLSGYKTLPDRSWESDTTRYIVATLTESYGFCPGCQDLLTGGVARPLIIYDLPCFGKYVEIHVTVYDRYCSRCKASQVDTPPEIDSNHDVTKRAVNLIYKRMDFRVPDVLIAMEIGINLRTIRRIREQWQAARESTRDLTCPEYMGIDEIYPESGKKKKANPYCVITDIGKGQAIEFLKGTTDEVITKFLASLTHKERLKAVAMDLTGHFSDVVSKNFHGVPIVRDKAHVLNEAKKKFNEVRNKIAKEFVDGADKYVLEILGPSAEPQLIAQAVKAEMQKRGALRNSLKLDRYLFTAPRTALAGNQQSTVRAWLKTFSKLKKSYTFLQSFYALYEAKKSARRARRTFCRMKKKLGGDRETYWKSFLETMHSYDTEIWAYFDSGLTNASTEAINRTIRSLIATSRGLKYKVLRAKILYTTAPSYFVEKREKREKPHLSTPKQQAPRPQRMGRKKKTDQTVEDQGGLFGMGN